VFRHIAGKKIGVEYYAPSMHGRKVMGGLVPFGQVWCTGANYATAITSDAALQMGGLKLPRQLQHLDHPTEKEWTLIVNKQTGQSHLHYDSSRDFGRTRMNLKTLASPVETFASSCGLRVPTKALWRCCGADRSLHPVHGRAVSKVQ